MESSSAPLCDAVFEALPCEIIVHDVDTIVAANASACRMLGAPSPRSLAGLPISTITHPETREGGAQRRALLFSRAQAFPCITVKLVGLDDNVVTTRILARRFDIAERALALVVGLESMGECDDSLGGWQGEVPSFDSKTPLTRAALDAMPYPINVFDREDTIVFSNAAATRVFCPGAPEGLVGKPLSAILHPMVREAAAQRRQVVLEHGQLLRDVATKAMALDGSLIHATGTMGRARLPHGEYVGFWMARAIAPVQTEAVTV